MPLILDDLVDQMNAAANGTAATKVYTPKFFDKKLTGSGKKSGIINEMTDPEHVSPMIAQNSSLTELLQRRKRTYTNGDTEMLFVPMNIIPDDMLDMYPYAKMPDITYMAKLIEDKGMTTPNGSPAVYASMVPYSLMLEERESQLQNGQSGGKIRKLRVCYRVTYLYHNPGMLPQNDITEVVTESSFMGNARRRLHSAGSCFMAWQFTENPGQDIADMMDAIDRKADKQPMVDYIKKYSLYDAICAQAEHWVKDVDVDLDEFFELVQKNKNDVNLNKIATLLRRLEDYAVPLELYIKIYNNLEARFDPDETIALSKQNMYLLLSSTLDSLNKNKHLIQGIPQQPNMPPVLLANGMQPSPEQAKAIAAPKPLVLVQSGAGTGKALPLDEPILTPTGWTTMGKLKVGDLVIGSNGKPCKVLRIHEQGLKAGYNLTFRDRSSARACSEHQWTICSKRKDGIPDTRKTVTTEEWVNNPALRSHYYLPIMEPVEFPEKDLLINPYFLGALLADGCFTQDTIQYTKSEQPVYERVEKQAKANGFEMYERTTETSTAKQWGFKHKADVPGHNAELKRRLDILGLIGYKSHEKFIPEPYLTASIEQRKQLIAGLFDGDGDVRTNRGYSRFNTSSEKLADGMLQLLWSLGLMARKQKQRNKKGDYWSVNLFSDYDPFIASEYAGKPIGTVKTMRRSLVSATPIDPVPMRCIEVDAPDQLYVTKDFIVTHNSSVIHARMNYMIKAGVDAKDITVLSFTNAAANHISELCPQVHSMTIAKMVDTIYHANYPNHVLSSAETIINCLDIYFSGDPIADKLKHKLFDVTKTRANSFINLNNFIEANYNAVLAILDHMGQTSLELEIIICYQKIDTFVEPPEVQSKYLIIDEVQDNSVFEFVYAIKYVEKHKESLYIVGDCSQTLYEFRASNPKALNVLEASGVFSTYQLQINYRSNQEILDFANVMLGRIEANQYAHIQLQANNLTPVTSKSFRDKVEFCYRQVAKIGEFNENMDAIYAVEVKPYIDKCLMRNEKVAFLAYTRHDVNRIMGILQHLYPGKSIVSLVSQKGYNSTILSTFIKKFWDKITFTPTVSIIPVIRQMVIQNLKDLGAHDPQKMMSSTIRMLDGWEQEQGPAIAGWQAAYGRGQMTLDVFMTSVRDSLLSYEIRNNAIRQSLLSSKNEEQKSAENVANADLLVSTIHGAKGLEFPNVVVSMRNKNAMPEDEKRMYYVALTRAMNSEFVLTYDTLVNPKVLLDYEQILTDLLARESSGGTAPAQTDNDDKVDISNAANANIAKARVFLKEQQKKEKPKAYLKGQAPKDDASNSGEPLDKEA